MKKRKWKGTLRSSSSLYYEVRGGNTKRRVCTSKLRRYPLDRMYGSETETIGGITRPVYRYSYEYAVVRG